MKKRRATNEQRQDATVALGELSSLLMDRLIESGPPLRAAERHAMMYYRTLVSTVMVGFPRSPIKDRQKG